VHDTLRAAEAGTAIALAPEVVALLVGLVVVAIIGRIGWGLAAGRPAGHGPATAEGGVH
jgi:hypothetical protein